MRIRERSTAVRSYRKGAGQSVVEFALILPIMLTLFGGAVDFSRVFLVDLNVQSATRNAAESVATGSITANPAATTEAQRLVCLEIVGTSPCTGTNDPKATATVNVSTTGPGASVAYPIATVTVTVQQPFNMLFPYPLMSPPGHWTLTAAVTFSVVRNR